MPNAPTDSRETTDDIFLFPPEFTVESPVERPVEFTAFADIRHDADSRAGGAAAADGAGARRGAVPGDAGADACRRRSHPNLESGTESGLVSGPDLSISAAGRAAPGDSQMRLELIAAAEAGDAGAQYRLAVDHFLGTHPRASDGRALYWYRRAAEQGHVPAQLLLGQMYESGWGVASDRAEAVRWYRRAAASGDSLAAGKLRVLGAGEA